MVIKLEKLEEQVERDQKILSMLISKRNKILERLKDCRNEIEVRICQDEFQKTQKAIASVEGEISEYNGQIPIYRKNVDDLAMQIQKLTVEMVHNRKRIKEIEKKIGEHDDRLKALEELTEPFKLFKSLYGKFKELHIIYKIIVMFFIFLLIIIAFHHARYSIGNIFTSLSLVVRNYTLFSSTY